MPVPEFMKILSKNIQVAFQELIKSLLRRSVVAGRRAPLTVMDKRPAKNLIDWYSYSMTYESIGWTGDIFATLRITPRTTGIVGVRPVTDCSGIVLINEKSIPIPPLTMVRRQKSASSCSCSTAPSHNYPEEVLSRYENFVLLMSGQNANRGLSLQSAVNSYTINIPYTATFRKLEMIGEDIINERDGETEGQTLTTLNLDQALSELELTLTRMSEETPFLYASYLQLIQIVNSLPKKSLIEFLRLVVILSYQRWGDLVEEKRNYYLSVLGADFIERFLNNELAALLIQSDNSQLILTTAYLYPLLKMLFCVFGYSRLEPFIIDRRMPVVPLAKRGLSTAIRAPILARNKCCSLAPTERIIQSSIRTPVNAPWTPWASRPNRPYRPYRRDDYPFPTVPGEEGWQVKDRIQERDSGRDFPLNTRGGDDRVISGLQAPPRRLPEKPIPTPSSPARRPEDLDDLDRAPYDPSLIWYIGLFRDLYPTLLNICGGIESIPPSAIAVECDLIPADYQGLTSIPEYLWRFNDYSFCQHSQLVDSRCESSFRLDDKIDAKVRYLRNI